MPNLSQFEQQALAYYAIGVSSEGGDKAYQLSFAGHAREGLLTPVGNSGYSIGEMQTDLGQHKPVARSLVTQYQAWANIHHPDWVLSDQQAAQLVADLGRDGRHIRDPNYDLDNERYQAIHHGASMPLKLLPSTTGQDIDPTIKAHLDAFLASDAGKSFVHQQDFNQVQGLVDALQRPLAESALYQNASPADQAEIFAMTAKAYNQSPKWGGEILADLQDGKITSVDGIRAKIDAFPDGKDHYMRTGRDAARAGARVFNTLQGMQSDHPLHAAWQDVMANPLVSPAALNDDPAHPHLTDEYAVVKGLFVDPAHGQAFVAALGRGASYNHGDPTHAHSRGLYAEGGDFLQWDRDGHGRAFINGQWSTFSREDISLVHNRDHTLDVALARNGQTERLLHVTHPLHAEAHHVRMEALHYGARGEAVETLQTSLAGLGYTGRDGHALRSDGGFGTDTLLAVEAFQREHGLGVDGRVGSHTQAAIQAATEARRMEAAVVRDTPAPLRTFSDPAHPQHALHAMLRGLLPANTTDARLAQATAACHLAGINKPEDLAGIYSGANGKIVFTTNSPFANMAEMDVSKPAPTVQWSLQQVQQFDQQQQMQTQRSLQQQPAQGPVMHP